MRSTTNPVNAQFSLKHRAAKATQAQPPGALILGGCGRSSSDVSGDNVRNVIVAILGLVAVLGILLAR